MGSPLGIREPPVGEPGREPDDGHGAQRDGDPRRVDGRRGRHVTEAHAQIAARAEESAGPEVEEQFTLVAAPGFRVLDHGRPRTAGEKRRADGRLEVAVDAASVAGGGGLGGPRVGHQSTEYADLVPPQPHPALRAVEDRGAGNEPGLDAAERGAPVAGRIPLGKLEVVDEELRGRSRHVGGVALRPLHEAGVCEDLESREGVEPVHLDVELDPLGVAGTAGAGQPDRIAQVSANGGQAPDGHDAGLCLRLDDGQRCPGHLGKTALLLLVGGDRRHLCHRRYARNGGVEREPVAGPDPDSDAGRRVVGCFANGTRAGRLGAASQADDLASGHTLEGPGVDVAGRCGGEGHLPLHPAGHRGHRGPCRNRGGRRGVGRRGGRRGSGGRRGDRLGRDGLRCGRGREKEDEDGKPDHRFTFLSPRLSPPSLGGSPRVALVAALIEVHTGEARHARVVRLNRGAGVAAGAGGVRHARAGADLERHRQRHVAPRAGDPGVIAGVDGEAGSVAAEGAWSPAPEAVATQAGELRVALEAAVIDALG